MTSKKDFDKITRSKLTKPTKQHPLFYTTNDATQNGVILKISPSPKADGGVVVNCITNPTSPKWDYVVGAVGQYVFNPVGVGTSTSADFQLDISEQTNLIVNILKYFGIVINDPTIIQVAEQESQAVQINEKS